MSLAEWHKTCLPSWWSFSAQELPSCLPSRERGRVHIPPNGSSFGLHPSSPKNAPPWDWILVSFQEGMFLWFLCLFLLLIYQLLFSQNCFCELVLGRQQFGTFLLVIFQTIPSQKSKGGDHLHSSPSDFSGNGTVESLKSKSVSYFAVEGFHLLAWGIVSQMLLCMAKFPIHLGSFGGKCR